MHDSAFSEPEAAEADFLVLVVDSTRAGALDALREALGVLPVSWWGFFGVVVTKGASLHQMGLAFGRGD